VCHGSPQNPIADLGRAQYPKAPQFMKDPPTDMTEGMTYYIVKHGVARTGMPAWDKMLTESDIWKLTAFLKRMDKLPPAVDAEWKKGTAPQAQDTPGQADHDEH
jgi:mono/diheme cytochrome c family protein